MSLIHITELAVAYLDILILSGLIICILISFGLMFYLGRRWERMEWDGTFDALSEKEEDHT